MGSIRRTPCSMHMPKYESHGGHIYCSVKGCDFHCSDKKPSTMSMHVSIKHKPATYDCPYGCDKKFSNKTFLRQHIASNHNDEKKFKCTKCNFTCKTKGTMLQHDIRHYNIKSLFKPSCEGHVECLGCNKVITKGSRIYHAARCFETNINTKSILTNRRVEDLEMEARGVPLCGVTPEFDNWLDKVFGEENYVAEPLDVCLPATPV